MSDPRGNPPPYNGGWAPPGAQPPQQQNNGHVNYGAQPQQPNPYQHPPTQHYPYPPQGGHPTPHYPGTQAQGPYPPPYQASSQQTSPYPHQQHLAYPYSHGSSPSYPPSSQYPVASQYPPTPQYPPTYQNPPTAQYPSNHQYPATSQYPSAHQYQNTPQQQQQQPPPGSFNPAYPRPDRMEGTRPPQTYTPPSGYAPHGSQFQYPNSSGGSTSMFRAAGRKRALLIGINYTGTPAELSGCVKDVEFVHYLLSSKFGFQNDSFVILTDNPTSIPGIVHRMPTRANMLAAMADFVQGANPGDSLFFQFSGHGSQVKDEGGDESDGKDETILPVDFKTAGQIIDDELYEILVKRVPNGARLTALLDCCHSGTGMELPYLHDVFFNGSGTIVDGADGRPSLAAAASNVLGAFKTGGGIGALKETISAASNFATRRKTNPHAPNPHAGEVVLFSGCMDSQVSADTNALSGSTSTGAMTYCFLAALEDKSVGDWRNYTYRSLLHTMRRKLTEAGLTQIPQLSSSHPMDLNSRFEI